MSETSEAYPLDTHIWIWLQQGDAKLGGGAGLVDQARSAGMVFVSAISVWEIGILERTRRVVLNHRLDEWIQNGVFRRKIALRTRQF